ncbi:N-acetylglucosamine-6-phosphate deacetylase [uncultured Ruegeria sp.]|uniref:N-acetylglucosamine-6-phosphate deacetylase n=1 Tax=uncultured Ruegeria sp. TaxID=259304 RepID=UPI00261BAA41|nr:N-acetylglucosamine-6-phosphate deacetylase [uncultured Ruegeria sp.]
MSSALQAITGAEVLTPDGIVLDHAVLQRDGRIEAVVPVSDLGPDVQTTTVDGGFLAPGFVDLQVNGGGGLMLNNAPEVETLRVMAAAHARIGATSILPTLITDTPEVTRRAVAAAIAAIAEGIPGVLGLHLEGPHLSVSRKGAHDAALIRPMEQSDLEMLLETATLLPVLKVTVAPEGVSNAQIMAMADAGILVSLGHTDASYDACKAAANAGARCVTHLFNAQSQMGNREPGTVGAALALGDLSAGLIADAIHVHPASVKTALGAKQGPGCVFLVSDAMATAGSDIESFTLNGREIHRSGDRLTLADGTLAGAHLELLDAAQNISELSGVALAKALEMASRLPADLIGQNQIGRICPGAAADILHIGGAGRLESVWQGGRKLS